MSSYVISQSGSSNVRKTVGRQFSPIVFYGSPNGVPPKRPLSLLRLLREIRIDLSEERKAISRYMMNKPVLAFNSTWKIFFYLYKVINCSISWHGFYFA